MSAWASRWMSRRIERQEARRFHHTGAEHRRCGIGFCIGCWWRSLTGQHRRNKAAMITRGRDRIEASRRCEHDWKPRYMGTAGNPPGLHARDHCDKCGTTKWLVHR